MPFTEYLNRNMSITQAQLSYLSSNDSLISKENDKTVKSYMLFCDNKLKENNQHHNNISNNNFSIIGQNHNNQLYPNIINIFNNNSCPDFILKEKKEKKEEKEENNLNKIEKDLEQLNKKYEDLKERYDEIILENQEIKKKLSQLENENSAYIYLLTKNNIFNNFPLSPEEVKILIEGLLKVKEKEEIRKKKIYTVSTLLKEKTKEKGKKKKNNNNQLLDENQINIIEKEEEEKKIKEIEKFSKITFEKEKMNSTDENKNKFE